MRSVSSAVSILAVLVLIPAYTVAGGLKAASYDLDVTFHPAERSMSAKAVVRFERIDPAPREAVFYLHGELEVEGVKIGDTDAEFVQEAVLYPIDYSLVAKRVVVRIAGADLAQGMKVTYSGPFNRSRARSPSDYMRIDSDGVLLRAYYYSPWFPIFLEPDRDSHEVDFNDVVLRIPQEFTTVFTGEHEGDRIENGVRISEWTAPGTELHAAQCTSRRFDVITQGKIRLYCEQNEQSGKTASDIARMVARLDDIYRRDYRKDAVGGQMHIMQMPRYGEISSGNVVGMTSEDWNGFTDSFNNKLTLAHELVHPFVQLKTDRDDRLHAMGVEGFPAFMHLPALQEIDRGDSYDKILAWYEKRYLERRETGKNWRGNPLPPEKPIVEITDEEIGDYKDSLVLGDRVILFQNWLRVKMGEEKFREFTRELFGPETGSYQRYRELLEKYIPDDQNDLDVWLESTEYPERFRLKG